MKLSKAMYCGRQKNHAYGAVSADGHAHCHEKLMSCPVASPSVSLGNLATMPRGENSSLLTGGVGGLVGSAGCLSRVFLSFSFFSRRCGLRWNGLGGRGLVRGEIGSQGARHGTFWATVRVPSCPVRSGQVLRLRLGVTSSAGAVAGAVGITGPGRQKLAARQGKVPATLRESHQFTSTLFLNQGLASLARPPGGGRWTGRYTG